MVAVEAACSARRQRHKAAGVIVYALLATSASSCFCAALTSSRLVAPPMSAMSRFFSAERASGESLAALGAAEEVEEAEEAEAAKEDGCE